MDRIPEKLSLSEIKFLTGASDRTVKSAVKDLTPEDGPKGAKLYGATESVRKVVAHFRDSKTGTLEEARTVESQAKAAKLQIEIETMQADRIPIELYRERLVMIADAVKRRVDDSDLPDEAKEMIFADIRDAVSPGRTNHAMKRRGRQ